MKIRNQLIWLVALTIPLVYAIPTDHASKKEAISNSGCTHDRECGSFGCCYDGICDACKKDQLKDSALVAATRTCIDDSDCPGGCCEFYHCVMCKKDQLKELLFQVAEIVMKGSEKTLCLNDEDCPRGCCSNGSCVPCKKDQLKKFSPRVAQVCDTDEDCPPGACCDIGYCIFCKKDQLKKLVQAIAAKASDKKDPMKELVSKTAKKEVERIEKIFCDFDEECPDGLCCVTGRCKTCSKNHLQTLATQIAEKKLENKEKAICDTDEDCGVGFCCNFGRCMFCTNEFVSRVAKEEPELTEKIFCDIDEDCPPGYCCVSGRCRSSCSRDQPQEVAPQVAHLENSGAFWCNYDSDCEGGEYCRAGNCYACKETLPMGLEPQAIGSEGENCYEHSDCKGGEFCAQGNCQRCNKGMSLESTHPAAQKEPLSSPKIFCSGDEDCGRGCCVDGGGCCYAGFCQHCFKEQIAQLAPQVAKAQERNFCSGDQDCSGGCCEFGHCVHCKRDQFREPAQDVAGNPSARSDPMILCSPAGGECGSWCCVGGTHCSPPPCFQHSQLDQALQLALKTQTTPRCQYDSDCEGGYCCYQEIPGLDGQCVVCGH